MLETKGNELFRIPNDETGQSFLKQLRNYLNRNKWAVRVRGRKADRTITKERFIHSIPLNVSKELAVYVEHTQAGAVQENPYYKLYVETADKLRNAEHKLDIQEAVINKRDAELNTLQEAYRTLKSKSELELNAKDNIIKWLKEKVDGAIERLRYESPEGFQGGCDGL